jgi:glycerol-3-phosphate dehydrogenase
MPRRDLAHLEAETWDLVVIGGGILGAGAARDAVLRGLRVALVEQADFGSGTSSRSTKLIHGGFRYLEHWQFGLVAEACRERAILQRLAPHLVWPLPFLLPVYAGDPRPLWKIRAGMTLYDWLAGRSNPARHRTLSATEAVAAEPTLNPKGLRGAVAFHDCQMDDARLCLETILDALHRGAAAVNYCELVGFETERARLSRAIVQDAVTGRTRILRSRTFLNAAGPWVERIAGLSTLNEHRVALSPTKGVHLVLPRLLQRHGIYFQSRRDDRMVFLLPYGDQTLLGTTDTNYPNDPADPHAEPADVEYLFDRLREVLPSCELTASDVVTSFAGVRPLLRARNSAPSHRPREHRLIRLGENLLTVAGGKYTTFRAISEQAVDAVYRLLGRRPARCATAITPLPDRRPAPTGTKICDAPPVWHSDVQHACREELAVTVSDVMRRRTRLALSPWGGEPTAQLVSQSMATELGWDEETRHGSLQDYLRDWERNRVWTSSPS